jgi:outer membrane protein assembly factor BamB
MSVAALAIRVMYMSIVGLLLSSCGELVPPSPFDPPRSARVVRPLWRSTAIAGPFEGMITPLDSFALIPNGRRLRLVNPTSGVQVWVSDSGNPRIGYVERVSVTPTRFVAADQGIAMFARDPLRPLWAVAPETWQPLGDRGAIATAVQGNSVFLTTGAGVVERRDAGSGALLWRTIIPGPCELNCRLRGIIPVGDTLWIVGDRRYRFREDDAALLALDAATGAVLWDGVGLGLKGLGPFATLRDSLLVVYGESSAQLAAFNIRRRTVQWLITMRPAGPTDIKLEGETVYVSSAEARVYAVALTTGAIRWMTPVDGSQFSVQLCPDRVVSSGFALHWLDKQTGRLMASAYADDGGLIHQGFAVVAGRVVAQTDRTVYAFPCQE